MNILKDEKLRPVNSYDIERALSYRPKNKWPKVIVLPHNKESIDLYNVTFEEAGDYLSGTRAPFRNNRIIEISSNQSKYLEIAYKLSCTNCYKHIYLFKKWRIKKFASIHPHLCLDFYTFKIPKIKFEYLERKKNG